ncbi:hypothetical protein ABC347_07835 [Sphingomonas sp. 1P06PA]|uniref:hypothetical protein n=1 Tax=Sphingomonas sp. 1P06PA TaxID=554121 RepID=UPI0039A4219C
MTKRRQRVDSVTAQVEVMQAAVVTIEAPAHVPLVEADQPFWCSILSEKTKAEWTGHDLELAAMLAIAMRRLRDEELALSGEDAVVTTTGGNLAANPRLRIVSDLHSRVMKYRQTLGIHNRGKNGEQRDVDKRRSQARVSEDAATRVADEDDLIARPTTH